MKAGSVAQTLRGRGKFRTYLYTIAHRRLIDFYRSLLARFTCPMRKAKKIRSPNPR